MWVNIVFDGVIFVYRFNKIKFQDSYTQNKFNIN